MAESSESRPLFVSIVNGHTELGSNSRKSPMVVCIFCGINAVRSHVQTRTIKVPRLVVPNTDRRAWGFAFLDINTAVADTSILTRRSCPGIACGTGFVGAKLRCDTTLAPDRAIRVQRTGVQASQIMVFRWGL